ncbi:uncharacterized protein TRAVEDRAFT_69572 [Trametes versicolor FP-101664 SS1]|uniref:uncharacterized protein n=1 Tax=Trametes versicolor (strain FP-101664) TaxID=717944 RepID=UPI0004623A50|nr:uncharacterized protein TRAVEDRAFT_69572 [Trametes versicolor FP-101664 SS1]EIW63656.1 hypothetical protein TRAVEDRAFT_69572 [Trametes versicolor FP-101664 SS1]
MGSCCSCCRQRRAPRSNDSDREPLLPANSYDALPPPKTPFEKIADVVAGVRAGKLPSQQQLDGTLRSLLASGVLDTADGLDGAAGEENTADAAKRVVDCAREACHALLQFGMEKNDDDAAQDLVHQLRQLSDIPVHADIVVGAAEPGRVDGEALARALPSTQEASEDAGALVRAIYGLVYVLATSAAFRLVLSDVFLIARETTADVAARVELAAAAVEKVAEDVEGTARPGGGTFADVKAEAGGLGDGLANELSGDGIVADGMRQIAVKVQQESPDAAKDAVIRRLQEAMEQAHRNPSFQSALRTVLALFRKYAAKVRTAATAAATAEAPTVELTPIVWADPPLAQALADLKKLLERIASGYPLDALLAALGAIVSDAVEVPIEAMSDNDSKAALREWFASLGAWLDAALADPAYATSEAGHADASKLYDRARAQLEEARSDPQAEWVQHLHSLLGEADAYLSALSQDRTTRTVTDALSALLAALTDGGATVLSTAPGLAHAGIQQAKRDALKGIVMWLLPRILRAVSAIPMPRVEYVDDTIEAAVDALLLTAPRRKGREEVLGVQTSLVPDRVRLESWNETVVEVDNTVPAYPSVLGGIAHRGAGLMALVAGTNRRTTHDTTGRAGTRTRTRVETHSRTRARVHVDGVRIAAHDVAYYVRYKGARLFGARIPGTSYEDEGLVSVEVGAAGESMRVAQGTGVSVDVELEFDTGTGTSTSNHGSWTEWLTGSSTQDSSGEEETQPLFRVTDVCVDVPGLDIQLTRTRHWMLNALVVQPLAGPVARAAVGWALQGQIRAALEAVASTGGRVRDRAAEKAARRERGPEDGSATASDWWEALSEEIGTTSADPEEDDADGEETPLVETHTRATAQGLIQKTTTHADDGAPAEESVLAVGIGAQALPGKGGPYGAARPPARAFEGGVEGVVGRGTEEAREAVGDVARAEVIEEQVRAGMERAGEMREAVRDAGARAEVRTRVEARRGGWRSRAFDALVL